MKKIFLVLVALLGLVFPEIAVSHDISGAVSKVLRSIAYVEVERFDINSLINDGIDDFDFQEVQKVPIVGTGFVIENNLIVTNFHVVEYAVRNNTKIRISFHNENGKYYYASVVGYDQVADVALLKIPVNRPSVSFCCASDILPGQEVFSISHFYGIEFSVTQGIISSIDRVDDRFPYVHQIQLQLLEGSGSSGGPVFNSAGMVVSMNQSILSMIPSAMAAGPVKMLSNVAFSIRSDTLEAAIARIKKEKVVRRTDLGVAIRKLDYETMLRRETAGRQKNLRGVMVIYVDQNFKEHPLQAGDIITRIGDQTITDPEQFFLYLERNYEINDFARVEVYRRGSTLSLNLPVMQAEAR